VQRDFLPGGSLAVRDGDAVVAPLLALARRFPTVIASRDFHPPDHMSFSARGGPWPAHCVAGSEGARIHADIDGVAGLVISKGMDRDVDAYSAFDSPALLPLLRSLGVERIVIGGLATDYCVRASALAAVASGLRTTVVVDAVRAVDVHPGDGARALDEMRAAGVALEASRDVAPRAGGRLGA
jgi:nicotinamidase-related amidase